MVIQKLLICTILSLKGAEKAPNTETQIISFESDYNRHSKNICGENNSILKAKKVK